jgi:hypothetical protein
MLHLTYVLRVSPRFLVSGKGLEVRLRAGICDAPNTTGKLDFESAGLLIIGLLCFEDSKEAEHRWDVVLQMTFESYGRHHEHIPNKQKMSDIPRYECFIAAVTVKI